MFLSVEMHYIRNLYRECTFYNTFRFNYCFSGNVFLEVVRNDEASALVLQIKLFTVSLQDLVHNFKPPVEVSKHVEWSNIVSNVVTGKQII